MLEEFLRGVYKIVFCLVLSSGIAGLFVASPERSLGVSIDHHHANAGDRVSLRGLLWLFALVVHDARRLLRGHGETSLFVLRRRYLDDQVRLLRRGDDHVPCPSI